MKYYENIMENVKYPKGYINKNNVRYRRRYHTSYISVFDKGQCSTMFDKVSFKIFFSVGYGFDDLTDFDVPD